MSDSSGETVKPAKRGGRGRTTKGTATTSADPSAPAQRPGLTPSKPRRSVPTNSSYSAGLPPTSPDTRGQKSRYQPGSGGPLQQPTTRLPFGNQWDDMRRYEASEDEKTERGGHGHLEQPKSTQGMESKESDFMGGFTGYSKGSDVLQDLNLPEGDPGKSQQYPTELDAGLAAEMERCGLNSDSSQTR